ncbi:MAG: HNH endonuclease [Prevotellaceae bacterium]|jgi:predicted HNH restriction endonuclease|nr:HNH endonuclease [Prevotellaceae bacterium]
MAQRITETELILPSLYLMSLNNGVITTPELIQKLRDIMKPTGEDLKILAKRNDDKFSQKVRNLIAHRTFERFGYAEYNTGQIGITNDGKLHLQNNQDILEYLLINDFTYADLTENLRKVEKNQNKKKIETFDENIIIQEGTKKLTQVAIYNRSTILRNYAIQYFEHDNRINCRCCNFNFQDFYGVPIGGGFIEIHHTKPIFKYEDEDLAHTLELAVQNLIPVCSNCHKMIHRNWSKPLEIQSLIENIDANGIFVRK